VTNVDCDATSLVVDAVQQMNPFGRMTQTAKQCRRDNVVVRNTCSGKLARKSAKWILLQHLLHTDISCRKHTPPQMDLMNLFVISTVPRYENDRSQSCAKERMLMLRQIQAGPSKGTGEMTG